MGSAVIVRTALPAGLERLRRRCVADAADGVPAHLTLLYPFVDPESLTAGARRALAHVAHRHDAFEYTLRRLPPGPTRSASPLRLGGGHEAADRIRP